MADKGSSTAKISLVANFEQNNIKAMGKQLSDGIKTSLKDIKLDTVFDDADILGGVKKEIESIDGLLKNRTLNRLDFSSMIPPLAQALEDNSLSEQIRLQIIQGFREGLESGRTFLQGMPSGMTGDEIKAQFRQSAIMSDAVDSMPGLNKSIFKKMWKEITPQDIRQAMAMMDTYDNEEDLRKYMDYLTDAETAIQTILDNIGYETKGSSQKTAMAYGRLKYLAEEDGSGKIRKILERLNNSVVGPSKHTYKDENGKIKSREDRGYVGKQIKDVIQQMQIDDEDLSGLIEDVQLISSIRDDYFSRISESDATIENLLAKTLQRGYKNGSLQKMEPLYSGNYKTPAHITLSDLVEASNKETDTSGGEGAENAAERAENAAERAENASEEARAVAEDMKGTVEEGAVEASGTSKKSKKKPSTQTSAEPAEQIADDAEADAESAEHVVDVLDDKKTRLENTITELENKNRELQELNNKYQKAISDTFGEVKTPEEALALFKEKAAQLQQADKDFADIVPQRNFTDPSNSEEIAILEEYEKRLAALQQALVEYQKAGETAMGKGVNPTDIRANQVDEERLQLNFADSTIDGYIKGLQKAIEDNKKKISEYENLLKTYRGQLEEFTRQGSPSGTKPSGGGQTQSRPAVDTAREEAGEVRKSREELQVEREKLEAEIQKSSQTMSKAEEQINQIDKDINWTGRRVKENEDIRLPAMKGFTQQAQQKKAELEEIEQELINVSQERESLENQLQQITQAKKSKINAQKWLDYIDSFIGNDNLQEFDRLQHIPFTEKGKPQKQKATDELKRISQLYMEHRQGIGDYADQDNGVWKDAYTVLHYRAMEQAKKHQVADSTLSREQFDSDNEYFYQESLNKLKEEREFYRKIYEEEDKTIRQNQEQLERLQELQNREKELQNAKKQKTTELNIAQDNVAGLQEVESEIQTDKTRLAQLQQQRAEQQHIYDDAKKIREESLQRQAEIDRMIAEAESREQQPPSTTPATTQEKPSAPISSGQAGEESPVIQNLEQQIKEVETTIKTAEIKQKELLAKKEELNKLLGEYGKEANNIFYLTDNTEETSQYWQQAGSSTKDPATGAARQLREKGQIFKDTIDAIKEQKRLLNSLDKESNEYQQAEQKLQQLRDKKSRDWLAFYRAHEQLDYWVGKEEGNTRAKQTLNKWTPEKMGLENLGFSQENLDKMIADVKGQAERLAQMRADIAVYQEQYNQLQEQINTLNTKRDNLITKFQRSKPAETEPPQGTSAETPLSSSGAETANGVQEEGTEAGDAAEKMQALAQAKKEALEANKQLAESANTTQKAIQNESDAGNFDELIAKLVEAAKLLAQLPQSFEGFKGFDLEPLKTLSEAIQQLPKEGLNISLGDSFDKLANNIDEVLKKVQELTSQAKIAEIEGNITQKYDEQIKQLKADAEEAKRFIEELKRTKQDVVRDEYDPRLDSSSEQYAPKEVGREIVTRAKRNPDTDVDALIKEYGNLKRAQEKLFTIDSVDEYSAALERREEILQRILELEQKVALSDVGQAQIDNLLMGYGEDASTSFSALDTARNVAQKSSIGRLSKNYTDQQKAEIKAMSDSLSSINIIPKDVQSNWGKKRREEYNQIAESAQTASQAIETLNANLAAMEANGANPTVLKTFLQLKESTAQMIKDTQDKNNVFGESIEAASTKLLDRLSNVETRLQVIKRDSGKLINVDPALAGALETIEKHLNKIQDLKNTVSNDPLQAINPQFTRSANSYLAQMEGKGKSKSVVEGLEQVSKRSQTDLDRIVNNYSRYTTALNKLFTDIAKGSKSSADELEKDFKRINDFSSKLVNATGLEQGDLLKGELKSSASPRIVDAQTEAYNKNAIAFEGMYTKIESKAESAKNKIEEIFGDMDITKSLDEKFIGGNVEGFDEFVQKATQVEKVLKNLKKIQETIKTDDTWLLQQKNADELRQTIATLETSLASVSKASSNFRIVDDLDVQELRASTKQYIRDNPALTGGEISELNNYIDQLQNKINTVDFKNIEDGIKSVQQTAKEAGHTGDTFMSMLTQRFKSLGAYLLSFVSFYEVIGVFKQGIGIIHELDDALTEMQKVSEDSLGTLREYQKTTFATANDIGTTAAQLQTSTADWMRLGEDLQQASQSAQTANVLFNVSEFDNINDATTALVAMSAAYADAEKDIDKMDIVDRLNLIGNNYAIATDELATALQDGAATLQTAGKQHCQNL
jgi:DNA repair exonuclease SbcCD ATPase subunit